MQNKTLTTGKGIQLILHCIRLASEHFDQLKHRATTIAGKPVSTLRVIDKKNVALASTLLSAF